MVKILKYSTNNLKQSISLLSNKIFILFYDLDSDKFNNVISLCKFLLNEVKIKNFKYHNCDTLVVFGLLNFAKLDSLLKELDSLDIGEFEISEYQNEEDVISSISTLFSVKSNKCNRIVYVNRDEKIIQLINFL